MIDQTRANRLFEKADAARWQVPVDVFTNTLEHGAEKVFAGRQPSAAELDRYLDSLHLADLALACACVIGRDEAWDRFVTEFRPALYRSADAIDPGGGAREVAEALYAELFGLKERDGIRQSLFRYFHGRSSLATWLRSLVAQRYVDRQREIRRLEPLPDESAHPRTRAPAHPRTLGADLDRSTYLSATRRVLAAAIAALAPRDRLRLACYYAQGMTLAQIGKLTGEHEATVSRHMARTRRGIRADVERRLHRDHGFERVQIDECFSSLVNDVGDLNLADWLEDPRKNSDADRSVSEDPS